MVELPRVLLDLVEAQRVQHRSPAYMLVARDGALREWGGHLQLYCAADPGVGAPVAEHLPFLVGLLPLGEEPLFLPLLETGTGKVVDLHAVAGEQGDWLLLLEAGEERRRRQLLQQRLNELSLLVEQTPQEPPSGPVERLSFALLAAQLCGLATCGERLPPASALQVITFYRHCLQRFLQKETWQGMCHWGDWLGAAFVRGEESGRQALGAAFGLVALIEQVNEERHHRREPVFALRIGIAAGTGLVAGEQGLYGAPLSQAVCLMGRAGPGQICIDATTHAAAGGLGERFIGVRQAGQYFYRYPARGP